MIGLDEQVVWRARDLPTTTGSAAAPSVCIGVCCGQL